MSWRDREPGSKRSRKARSGAWTPCCHLCEKSLPGRERPPRRAWERDYALEEAQVRQEYNDELRDVFGDD